MEPFRCATCSRSFKRNWHLTRHEQSHSIERPFKCPLCVRVFARQDTLSRHLSSHAKARIRKASNRSSDSFKSSLSSFSCSLNRDPEQLAGTRDAEKLDRDASNDTNRITSSPGQSNRGETFQSVLNLHESSVAVSPVDHPAPQTLAYAIPEETLDIQTTQLEPSVGPSVGEPDRLGTTYPQPSELPDELYTSTVDLHARRWLRDLCASDNRVTTARPND